MADGSRSGRRQQFLRTAGKGSRRAKRVRCKSCPPAPSEVARDHLARPLLRSTIDNTLRRALHKQPEQRHASMSELAPEIEAHTRMLVRC
jgi:hypothetical protein